ncbi:MAG: hypothetical protein ABF242_03715 [Flavobacteriales bacterium]
MINKKNRLLAVFFIAFFAANIILPSIVLVHFKINQEYIASTLCVEKELEESTCAGSCQLKKSLAAFEKGNSEEQELNFLVETHISFLYVPIILEENKINRKEKKISNRFEQNTALSGYSEIPFRPPILLS